MQCYVVPIEPYLEVTLGVVEMLFVHYLISNLTSEVQLVLGEATAELYVRYRDLLLGEMTFKDVHITVKDSARG